MWKSGTLIVLSLFLAACSSHPSQAVWDRANIDDYTLRVGISCFCDPSTYVVTVRDGQVTDVAFSKGDEGRLRTVPETVDDFYGVIDGAGDADSLKVTFNDVGVPTTIAIDPTEFSDDEVTYTIDFEPDAS